jgi:hypothetical protein
MMKTVMIVFYCAMSSKSLCDKRQAHVWFDANRETAKSTPEAPVSAGL